MQHLGILFRRDHLVASTVDQLGAVRAQGLLYVSRIGDTMIPALTTI